MREAGSGKAAEAGLVPPYNRVPTPDYRFGLPRWNTDSDYRFAPGLAFGATNGQNTPAVTDG